MLYTGKGDGGTTKMFGCDQQRISKSSELPEALGALDELNAFIGFVKMRSQQQIPKSSYRTNLVFGDILRDVQEKLFITQAEVAGADKHLVQKDVEAVEVIINDIEKEIPPLKGFSIAGGTELSALLDVARTLARRAERRLTAVAEAGLRELAPETRAYMNRLSSLLFALARLANHLAGVAEETPTY
ncbi:ATP:cob(I)alamin adenosyltransferase [Candidatus Kaiserbacteria bacterium RIFCSPLOWO2_01_FULL_52_12b]|uniref:Corrinoid adenosyltransferase n=1 Tax=Candidatus Kaiserbacteria bacterium RIFCSPLOWO2_01_FULL_52_12b TaxID=1798509 RepID=A0A1F6EXW5_9BACT|nr:MAG: ATP:cob(I)alamin adenosyltransferase [Candidatus Kaiserbacteria bacterium RIFCSPLOWO2_01_FULL_52_12b]